MLTRRRGKRQRGLGRSPSPVPVLSRWCSMRNTMGWCRSGKSRKSLNPFAEHFLRSKRSMGTPISSRDSLWKGQNIPQKNPSIDLGAADARGIFVSKRKVTGEIFPVPGKLGRRVLHRRGEAVSAPAQREKMIFPVYGKISSPNDILYCHFPQPGLTDRLICSTIVI